jgi:CRP-like cAMP-binding protein
MLNNTLRQVPLFAQLKDDELRCLEQGEELWLSPGEEFITEGQPAENFYVLLEGRVRVTKKMSANKETFIASHDSGTFLGEVPILLGISYEVTIRTLEQSHLFKIKKETFWQMISTLSINNTGNLAHYGTTCTIGTNCIATTSKAYFTWEFGSWTCS